ncbi:MAG: NUDIX hydrolase [Aureispira sp.]|nr:NUDIX hydrolase [Aureispira sp.]
MPTMDNPWKTLQSKPIYDNPWINVTEHDVLNPAGNPGIYGVVSFKNIAVGILPLDKDLNTWLVGQYRYSLNEYSWEIPEGGCPIASEDILTSAKRELQEETGLEAQKWTKILKTHISNSVTDEVGYSFIAQDLTIGQASPEDTEDLKLRKLPFQEAFQMCLDGKITDSLSVLTLFKVNYLLENKLL